MLRYLFNIIRLLAFYGKFSKDTKLQKAFIKAHFEPVLEAAKQSNDGTLDEEDFRKLRIYAITIPSMLGEAFCTFRNKPMTEQERMAITFLGSMTGLFDDLFDRRDLTDSYIENLLEHPTMQTTNNANERLLVELFSKVLGNTDKHDLISGLTLKVYAAQVLSREQTNNDLTREQISTITYEKGGATMQLYRCAFDGEIDEIESELVYMLGAVGQLENDIFDVYKDYQEGIRTLVTTETDIRNLQENYRLLIDDTFSLIEKTNYPAKSKTKFRLFAALVIARGLVGLSMLLENQYRTQNVFSLAKYKRNDLICDMEKPHNVLKLLHYAASCAK